MSAGAVAGACLPAGASTTLPATPAAPATADRCPRCGGGFQCGRAGPAPCACSTVRLDADTGARLRQRYSGCLCLRCLGALAGGLQTELQTGLQIDLPTDSQIDSQIDLQTDLPTRPAAPHPAPPGPG